MRQNQGNVGPIDFGVNTPMPIPQPQIRTMEDRMGAGQMPAINLPNNPQANIPAVNLPFKPPSFGQTQQQPFQAQPQQPPPIPGVNPQQGQQPVDFAAEYAKLNSNRPNRLAYQQSIEQGEPQIQRGKWAKLGAMLAAAGGSVTGGAQAGANLGLSSYYEPQRRATELHDKKQRGLGNLANMEEQDIANQIKALEAKQQDYYRNREDVRQQTELERQGTESTARLANIQDEMNRRDLVVYTDPKTGMTYRKNLKDQSVTEVGKGGLSTEEQVELAKQKADAEEKAKLPGIRERIAGDKAVADIGYRRGVDTANINANKARELAANKARTSAKAMRPGDVYGNVLLDFAEEVGKEDSQLEPRMLDWIKPNEAGIPTVTGDWRSTTEQEDLVRKFIKQAIEKHRAVPGAKPTTPATPTAKLPPGWSR